ncbi:hypothetical protein [Streptomyces beihaiensis]|uniref:Integral membrane protein n=1 Tax=Streptomyces beihaiensis TaxID=2984495 RepID=A0ABT3U1Y2_9ACTN|nr:hypothetical protein [Streptomyces beihaiensis]MCX3062203.1 hypothetical protein [Streptomyces beihaiensis]
MSLSGGDRDDHDLYGDGHTRTRLPEQSGSGADGYGFGGAGGRRPGRSPSRSLVMIVGVVVLLVAAIALANRGDTSADGGGSGAGSARGTGAGAGTGTGTGTGTGSGAKADPTAPTGTKPVSGGAGFAHDEQGAQSAAANYAVKLGGDGMFNPDRRHAIVDAVYTPAAAAKLKGPMDKAYSPEFLKKLGLDAQGNPPQGSTFVSRTIPVGTKTIEYGSASAKVSVWYMGLLGISGTDSTNPVTTSWQTWTFNLQWSDGDWKVASDSQKNGPTPVPGDERASSSDAISKAIEEYGGFTYAR